MKVIVKNDIVKTDTVRKVPRKVVLTFEHPAKSKEGLLKKELFEQYFVSYAQVGEPRDAKPNDLADVSSASPLSWFSDLSKGLPCLKDIFSKERNLKPLLELPRAFPICDSKEAAKSFRKVNNVFAIWISLLT